jgi:hypothetical protein
VPETLPPDSPQPRPRRKPGPKPKPAQVSEQLVGIKYVKMLQSHLDRLAKAYPHHNRTLCYDHVLVAYLLAFYNPLVRSLRTINVLSTFPKVKELLGDREIAKSTLSDANRVFDPKLLEPVILDLQQQIPGVQHQNPELAKILQEIIAGDGSMFRLAADVAWALHLTKSNEKTLGQARFNLQLNVITGLPRQFSVSGNEQGSESAAFKLLIEPGVIYLHDRNFVDFDFIEAVLKAPADLVVRLKSDTGFRVELERPLTDADREYGILADGVGYLGSESSRNAPDRLMREVVVLDPKTGKPVRLLTTLMEVAAYVIGLLYRERWKIELFFRWLKCWGNFEHLISHSQNGVLMQFYAAVIGVLLSCVRSGRRMSKYAFLALGLVAAGMGDAEDALRVIERYERERELERARLARKKAAKKQA